MKEILRSQGPDYGKCLVNLSNSILKKYGAQTTADTLPAADKYLAKRHRNTVILLLDALGISILEKHLSPDGFFRSNLKEAYYSVYPPTTVAATTSLLSGLYPNEHGWLGWDMYYPELNKNVTVFTNTDQLTEKDGELIEPDPAADFNAGFTYTPYKNIVDKIIDAGVNAYFSTPFMPPHPGDLGSILTRVRELCDEPGEKFIYAYWNEPDSTMHKTGTASAETHDLVNSLEHTVSRFASKLTDTLLIITADHSQIDSNNLCILDYPEITDCLERLPSIEPRTLNFFVKKERLEAFPEIFRSVFGNKFLLMTKAEVLETKLFGPGKDHPLLPGFIGDYVALALSDTSVFVTHQEAQSMPGGHAGLTAEENRIPLIIVEGD